MPQIKVNINTGNSRHESEEIIEEARKRLREKQLAGENLSNNSSEKTTSCGKKLFFFFILLIAANVATFYFINESRKNPCKKFFPESTKTTLEIPAKEIKESLLSEQQSLIFPQTITQIKKEIEKIGINITETSSELPDNVFIVSVKHPERGELENIVLARLQKNSMFKQKIEEKIRQNFNFSYSTYRGENVTRVTALGIEDNFIFYYAFVENVIMASNSEEAIKLAIDSGKW